MATTARTISLLPVEIDISVVQGTTATLDFQLKKYDTATAAWVAEDITSDSVKFTAREDYGGTVKISTKTNASGQHLDAVNGKTRFVLSKTEIALADAASSATWRYEVRRVVGGAGDEIVYMRGKLKIDKTVGTGTVAP